VGYDEAGQLTETVRRRPYCVICFDEVEKAHAEVINLLLQLLDDGRLTDGHGRTVDFKNTVVIMTSNIGSHYIMEFGIEAAQDKVLEALRQHFRPEFLNRVDEIVVFHSLSRDDLARIVDIQLERLETLLAERKLALRLTNAARDFLSERSYDPVFGARPLKRAIQHYLQDSLALAMLEGEFGEGETVEVDVAGDELVFHRIAAAPHPTGSEPEVEVVEGEIVE
jgi:ATP-dependent Clp protease ATP-binding subunit ClpB